MADFEAQVKWPSIQTTQRRMNCPALYLGGQAQSRLRLSSVGVRPSHLRPGRTLPRLAARDSEKRPVAGIMTATTPASAYVGKTVRNDTAMAREISLSRLVLPVGGIKETTPAIRRAGT